MMASAPLRSICSRSARALCAALNSSIPAASTKMDSTGFAGCQGFCLAGVDCGRGGGGRRGDAGLRTGMKQGPGKVSVGGDVAEDFGRIDPGCGADGAFAAQFDGHIGDAIDGAEGSL